jgi:hypothetical protein
MIKTYLEDIEEMATSLNEKKSSFLRERGWDYSSQHPDFCWRWTKLIGGRTYALSIGEALNFEEHVNYEQAWKNHEKIDA